MKFEYKILPERRCIVQRLTGEIPLRHIMESTRAMWAEPLYDPAYHGITDMTACISRSNPSDIMSLVSFLNHPSASTGRWAAIFNEPRGIAMGLLFRSTHTRFNLIIRLDSRSVETLIGSQAFTHVHWPTSNSLNLVPDP